MAEQAGSVVLLSGGMDSLVTAAIAVRESDASFLHVSYGQRTERRERAAFDAIADHYGVKRRLALSIESLRAVGGSSLTDPSMPVRTGGVDRSRVPDTYVPFRNAHLAAIAVSWAEGIGASRIYIGAVEQDSSGYPDCTRAFFDAFEKAARLGAARAGELRILTPLIHLSKAEIVRLGLRMDAPFHLSWSCYVEEERACGLCDSCRLRLEAFRGCGVADPIPYAGTPPPTP
ncbi:MAG: 7-cyano-7-deazaguanine synthase QueC [Candidatus Eisenbacteria bacterium]|nr:7-cyano-7-deazaguanine synthase QueC [Candidatus Eisenbacteria bacterium]